nr:hypothetical protein [Desulforamulus aquiferis]
MALNRFDEGIRMCEKYQGIYPEYTDLVYLKGALYFNQGQLIRSLDCMNKCLTMGPPPNRYFSSHGIAAEKPLIYIKNIIAAFIKQGEMLINQGDRIAAHGSLVHAYQQLMKQPDEKLFEKLIELNLLLINSVENTCNKQSPSN